MPLASAATSSALTTCTRKPAGDEANDEDAAAGDATNTRPAASSDTPVADGTFSATFDVSNTGAREGSEIAQVYVADSHARVPRPAKELKAFKRVRLRPGETQQVTITFDNQDAGIPHNIHVFKGTDATAPSLFAGPLVTGPAKQDYSFAAPPPGSPSRYTAGCPSPSTPGTIASAAS